MKHGMQGAVLVFFSVCSFTTAAVVVPSEVIGAQELNAQSCVEKKANPCKENCHSSGETDCTATCVTNAELSCQSEANQ